MSIRKENLKFLITFIIIALLTDQISKIIVMNSTSPTNIIGSFLRFKLTYNPYGVFGISFGSTTLYYILAFVGIVALTYFALSVSDKTNLIILGLIIGGALGNITDRIRMNYVVDFIDMGIGNLRWFTYNLADAFITVGAVFLLIRESFIKKSETNPDLR